MPKPLTAFAIAAIKPGAVRREIPDGQVQGLRIVVQPSGALSWALRYRFHGKPAKLTIGPWPAIDLKSARALAQKAHVEIASGVDPCAVKREKKAAARLPVAATVKAVLADFIRLYAKRQTRRSPARWPGVWARNRRRRAMAPRSWTICRPRRRRFMTLFVAADRSRSKLSGLGCALMGRTLTPSQY